MGAANSQIVSGFSAHLTWRAALCRKRRTRRANNRNHQTCDKMNMTRLDCTTDVRIKSQSITTHSSRHLVWILPRLHYIHKACLHCIVSHYVNGQVRLTWSESPRAAHRAAHSCTEYVRLGRLTIQWGRLKPCALFITVCLCFMREKEEMIWSLMTTMTIYLNTDTSVWVWFQAQDNENQHGDWFGNTMCCITGWVCMSGLFDLYEIWITSRKNR